MEKGFKNIVQKEFAVISGGCWMGREGSKDRKGLTNKGKKKNRKAIHP